MKMATMARVAKISRVGKVGTVDGFLRGAIRTQR